MRRSAAPSQKCGTDCKRSKFTVPKTVTSTTRNSKLPCERKISVDLTIDDHNDHKDNASDPDRKLHSTSPKIDNSSTSSCMIMIGQTLIVDRPPETTGATLIKKAISIDHDKKAALSSSKPLGELQNRTDQENAGKITGNEMESRYFGVVWCKRSNKKHKKWEGDAVLCSLSRSVTLLDMEGKEIGKASGFKIQELSSLTVGQTLAVGAKEVEIVSMISEVSFLSGECFIRGTMTPSSDSTELPKEVKISKYKVPLASGSVAAVSKELKPRFDPAAPGALVLPRPTEHLVV